MDARTRKQFEEDLARIVRREGRLRAALAGSADVERIQVKAVNVRAHKRGAHWRTIVKLRSKK